MNQLLFVDDEQNILDGIRRMLRLYRKEWNAEFCNSGEQALQLLNNKNFDIVISDTMMPGMNGVVFLEQVMNDFPNTVRISLTGHMNKELAEKNTLISHQQLAKPCDAEKLKNTILTSLELRRILNNEKLSSVVSQISSLPSKPQVYFDIVKELESSDASLDKVGEIIASDAGMVSKLLQLVNSAFFGLPRNISNPLDAASYLGLDIIQGLVLSIGIFSQFENDAFEDLDLNQLHNASLETSSLCKAIGKLEKVSKETTDHAQVSGLLLNIGILILSTNLPNEYKQIIEISKNEEPLLWQAEDKVLGCNHAEIGAYLLGLWGLPKDIIKCVSYYHSPSLSKDTGISALTLVHVAHALHMQQTTSVDIQDVLDMEYIERVGLAEHINSWRDNLID